MRKKSASFSYTPQNLRVCRNVFRGGICVRDSTVVATGEDGDFSAASGPSDDNSEAGILRWYVVSSTTKKARMNRPHAKANST